MKVLEISWVSHKISRCSKFNNKTSQEIQMVITFNSDVWFRHIICRDAQNWTRKLSAYSNDHNFWLRFMYEAHDILRRSKLNNITSQDNQRVINLHSNVQFRRIIYEDARNWTQMLSTYSNGHNFWLGCLYESHDISGRLTMNNGSYWEIQMFITFHSNVRFRRIIYRDGRNWTQKLSANSNDDNFLLGCMCEAHHISGRSTMNTRSSRELKWS